MTSPRRSDDSLRTQAQGEALVSELVRAIREPEAGPVPLGLDVYRTLVRARFVDVVALTVPLAVETLGMPALRAWVHRFVAEQASRSPYFADVGGEFVAWAAPHWEADSTLPPWLAELARFEVARFELAGAVDEAPPEARGSLDLDLPVALQGPIRLLRSAWSVQRPPPCVREPTALLLYRNLDFQAQVVELSPAAGAIVERLLAGEPLRHAIEKGCADAGIAADDSALAGTAAVLANLADRGVLLGALA
jgi:hypothetical protein